MGFRLTIEKGTGSGQSYDFHADQVTIGRGEENDIVLYDNGCSKQHARISRGKGGWSLEDVGSANGTRLNGQPVSGRQTLSEYDSIAIGGVVFRFSDLEDLVSDESTRVGEVPRDDITPAPGDTTNVKKAPTGPRSPALLAAVALLALVVAGGVAFNLLGQEDADGSMDCSGLALNDRVRDFVFGNGEVEVQCGGLVRFGFNHQSQHRVILSYSAFYTERGEVEIQLNGERIGEAPIVQGRESMPQIIVLPAELLKEDAANFISFVNTRGHQESWGIERVSLESIGLAEADPDKARESFDLATARFRERKVAAPNLYTAWINYREARRYMEGLEVKPDIYEPTLQLIRDIEKELDKQCRDKLFQAQRHAKYDRYREANDVYRAILAHFPGTEHPCRSRAEASMYIED